MELYALKCICKLTQYNIITQGGFNYRRLKIKSNRSLDVNTWAVMYCRIIPIILHSSTYNTVEDCPDLTSFYERTIRVDGVMIASNIAHR